jgi:glutamine amidotransferase
MIAIIDYKAGNLTSVKRALDSLGKESIISNNYSDIVKAERIIFPGVGAAGNAIADLRRHDLDKALWEVYEAGKPILGICLGTQVILEKSQENDAKCLGLVKGEVRRFPENLSDKDNKRLKIPHMGWNGIKLSRKHPVFEDVPPESEFYFVHAYYPNPKEAQNVLGETDYGINFASIIVSNNLVAAQFHPEKSGRPGLKILSNFCDWNGVDDVK